MRACVQDGNAWIMTFHQFYAWNGCSNQALATRLGKQYDVLQYYMCPNGTHEGVPPLATPLPLFPPHPHSFSVHPHSFFCVLVYHACGISQQTGAGSVVVIS